MGYIKEQKLKVVFDKINLHGTGLSIFFKCTSSSLFTGGTLY
jgi:hypothetical protein